MTAGREEILDDGQERLMRALLRMRSLHDQCMAAAFEAERIRREVEAATGVSLIEPLPLLEPFVDGEFRVLMESAFFPEGLI